MTPPMQIGIGMDISRGGGAPSITLENTEAPAITGTAAVGEELSCSAGTWSVTPDAVAYQWEAAGAEIAGATDAVYTVLLADINKEITCVVTATYGAQEVAVETSGLTVRDADAQAYVAAVLAAEATVTAAQRNAINTFVAGEKAASRWASIKRFYLPIWSAAAPNAIDIVTRTSGTFAGTVSHEVGFVQSVAGNGYFNTGVNVNSLGLTTGSASAFSILYAKPTAGLYPQILSTGNVNRFGLAQATYEGTASNFAAGNSNTSQGAILGNTADALGVLVGSRFGSATRFIGRRSSAGWSVIATRDDADIGALSTASLFAMAMNNSDASDTSPVYYNNGKFGLFGCGLGLTAAQAEGLSASLKTLWETCTGLSLA